MRVFVMLVTIALLANVVQADDPSNARRPKNDVELRVWLENMIWHHRYSNDETTAATSLTADEIKAARVKFRHSR